MSVCLFVCLFLFVRCVVVSLCVFFVVQFECGIFVLVCFVVLWLSCVCRFVKMCICNMWLICCIVFV